MAEPSRKLPLVPRDLELSGQTSPEVERFVRSVVPRSSDHDGLLRTFSALVRSSAEKSVPPSSLHELIRPIRALDTRSPSRTGPSVLGDSVRTLSAALPTLETRTRAAVSATQKEPPGPSPTGSDESTWALLNRHADAVFERYVSLSVHLAGESVLSLLDAVSEPVRALDIVPSLGASRAYQQVALGSLRFRSFRERAFRQAVWDAARPTSRALEQDTATLAPQILHEFLGARFRAHAQAEHALVEAFLGFALTKT